MNKVKILSIDIDYCLDTKDVMEVFDLFCKVMFSISDSGRVLIADYHVDILDLFGGIDGALEVYNIDLHHDIFYDKSRSVAEVKSGIASSADWVLWSAINLNLASYTWVKQPGSEEFSQEMMELFSRAYRQGSPYTIVDARNILFSGKHAILQTASEKFLKDRPKIATKTRIDDELKGVKFDYLFVCLSPEYTARERYFLYEMCKSARSHYFKSP